MQLRKTNHTAQRSYPEKRAGNLFLGKSILAVVLLLAIVTGLYFLKSESQKTLLQPGGARGTVPSSQMQEINPEASPSIVPVANPKDSRRQTAPHIKTANIVLNMDKLNFVTPKENFMAPRWSPDGLDILATKGKYKGLYLIASDGSNVRRISDVPGIGYNAHWSPDGRYIVVTQDDGTHYYDRNGDEVDADYVSPQRRAVVYAEDGAIYFRSPDDISGEDQLLIADGDQYFEPTASPDGSKVAFIGLESGIVIKDLVTQENIIIGEGTDVSWMPDGEGIIFNFTQDDGERILAGDIYFASADGRIMENLTNSPDVIERRPDITPDGSQLTFEAGGRIVTVDILRR